MCKLCFQIPSIYLLNLQHDIYTLVTGVINNRNEPYIIV